MERNTKVYLVLFFVLFVPMIAPVATTNYIQRNWEFVYAHQHLYLAQGFTEPDDIVWEIQHSKQILHNYPREGNWDIIRYNPTADFGDLWRFYDQTIVYADSLNNVSRDSDAYFQGLDDLRDRLGTLMLRLKTAVDAYITWEFWYVTVLFWVAYCIQWIVMVLAADSFEYNSTWYFVVLMSINILFALFVSVFSIGMPILYTGPR